MEVTKNGVFSASLEKESTLHLPSLRQVRKGLSRTDYGEYLKEKARVEMLEAKDPVAYLLAQKEYFEKELQSENYYRRGKAQAILDQLAISIESARKIAAEKAEMLKDVRYKMEETVSELREAALQKGPTWPQKLQWKIGDALHRSGVWLGFIPKTLGAIWHWYEQYCQWLVVGVWVAAVLAVIIFSAFSGLGLNFIFYILLLGIAAAFSFIHAFDFKESLAGLPSFAMSVILLLILGVVSMFSGWCFAPQKGWTVVTKRGAEIVQVINSEEWWMRSPRLWQREKLEFIDLTNGKNDDHSLTPYEILFGEKWQKKVGEFNGKPVFVKVTALREVISSGLRGMVEENRQPSFYRADIQTRVEVFMESFPSSKNPATALPELKEKISGIKNSVFGLKEVQVSLDF